MVDQKKVKATETIRKIFYIGEDRSFWQTVQQRYVTTYQAWTFDFKMLTETAKNTYRQIFLRIFDERPAIIYVDFSTNFQNMTNLALLIKRENLLCSIPLVGLASCKEELLECYTTGSDFVHIKGGEYHDIVYDACFKTWPKAALKKDFAKARFQKEITLIQDLRLGYITANYLHVEGDIVCTANDSLVLQTEIPDKIVPSKTFTVKTVYDHDLYYNFSHAYDLQFTYIDKPEFVMEPGLDAKQVAVKEKEFKQKTLEYQNDVKITKKKLTDWVNDHQDAEGAKKTKILVYDNDLTVFRDNSFEKSMSNFSIRVQSVVSSEMHEIEKLRPHIIVYQFPMADVIDAINEENSNAGEQQSVVVEDEKNSNSESAGEVSKSSVEIVTELIRKVKLLNNYQPFFLVFNSRRYSSKSFQDSTKYPFILANTTPLSLQSVIDMGTMFEIKQKKKYDEAIKNKIATLRKEDPKKYGRITASDFEERKYIVKKTQKLSFASINFPVLILTMTESEMQFITDRDLPYGSYRTEFPVSMSLTVFHDEDRTINIPKKGHKLYRGLIHSCTELDKAKIRQFVNTIFTQEASEKRQKEISEFADLNKKKMEESSKAPAATDSSSDDGSEEKK